MDWFLKHTQIAVVKDFARIRNVFVSCSIRRNIADAENDARPCLTNKLVAVGIVAALLIGVTVSYYWPYLNTPPSQPLETKTTSCVRPPGYILIIADLQGFNDSVGHLRNAPNDPWPVVRVHLGDMVKILVCNQDDYSPHGFAVQHYFDAGAALMPHESLRISFVADQVGTFTIYCNILCPVHSYMQSGQLMVT